MLRDKPSTHGRAHAPELSDVEGIHRGHITVTLRKAHRLQNAVSVWCMTETKPVMFRVFKEVSEGLILVGFRFQNNCQLAPAISPTWLNSGA
jgi:hypothetical protein